MVNPIMFKEWCEELHNKNKSVLVEFKLLIQWNGWSVKDIPDIQERVEYIISEYGDYGVIRTINRRRR